MPGPMVAVDAEDLDWHGVNVGNWAIAATDVSGLLALPERRGENLVLAGRDGSLRVQRKPYNGREFVVEYLVRGATADGLVPAHGMAEQFYRSMDLLASLCVQDVGPLVHTLPGGGKRTLDVEVLNAVEPDRWRAGMAATVKIAYTSASAWWRGLDVVTADFEVEDGDEVELTEFAASSGRIDDAVVTFYEGTNPLLTDTRSGYWIAYDEAIGEDESISLGNYQAPTTGGLVFDRHKLRHDRRSAAWFVLDPVPGPDGPTVRLNHNGGGTMRCTIAARQSWAVG